MPREITVIGGGLAGCEAALAAARQGCRVVLWDMKPGELSPAHHNPRLGELVCSNSLRSNDPANAVGLLKLELALLGSAVIAAALASKVPAGRALAVDREAFAAHLEGQLAAQPLITRRAGRVDQAPREGLTILATGPLTAPALAADLAALTGAAALHFYDAIAPIVTAESVDPALSFWANRWDDSPDGDYLNCPLTEEEYGAFYQALMAADHVPLHDFENPRFFEGCLPIEVMAERGPQTLAFGPLKPVGLPLPGSGRRAYAVVQLRREDPEGRLLNLVGFQTKLTHPSQERVFRLIPALARAEFVRLGSIHRNTFLEAPKVLRQGLVFTAAPHLLAAGQLSGVEGYVESAAHGLLAGFNAARLARGQDLAVPPPTTALGGLISHLTNRETPNFQPSNINFGLLPPLGGKKIPKRERGGRYARRAMRDLALWLPTVGLEPAFRLPSL
ncbi:MAG: methylenetetrahydrofolate--tRNA-(uracil(54)-C(5))-methyltransferase (FADH(2)-oxidizing) TrmFO [Deltaproteobacteria bacterium]|nr:methylenetetrahydrofolate--tRNA-(uracil(54)-C(5))-methyltransferase (FADH(2)-oxidizing) TrmFO [Deltaproteobacteria bacterium]